MKIAVGTLTVLLGALLLTPAVQAETRGKAYELRDGRKVQLNDNKLMVIDKEPDSKPVLAKEGQYRLKGGGVIDVGEEGIIIIDSKPVKSGTRLKVEEKMGIVIIE